MVCTKCKGCLEHTYSEIKCLNCGKRWFNPRDIEASLEKELWETKCKSTLQLPMSSQEIALDLGGLCTRQAIEDTEKRALKKLRKVVSPELLEDTVVRERVSYPLFHNGGIHES